MTTTTNQADRLEIVLIHLVDRFRDELGRIVDDVVAEPRRKLFDRSSTVLMMRPRSAARWSRALEQQERHGRALSR